MIRFAVCNELFGERPLAEVAAFVKALGYEGIELAPFTLASSVVDISQEQRRMIRRIVEDNGLEIVGLHWLLVKPEGLHITHPDSSVRRRTCDYLKTLVDFCADVGGRVMTLGSPRQRNVLPGVSRQEAEGYFVDVLRQCGDLARERSVTICLEALPSAQTNFLNTSEEVARMVRKIDHPGVRMMLDVKSMCSESTADSGGRPLPEIIRSCAGLFDHFHANDSNLKGPGFGNVDFVPIMKALLEVGYEGYVSVEAFDFSPSSEVVASGSLEYMRRCLDAARRPGQDSP